MTYLRSCLYAVALLGGVALAPGPARAVGDGKPAAANSRSSALHVEYEHGVITARASNVALVDLVSAFERATGVKFHLADPRLGQHVLCCNVSEEPLEQALRTLLSGFSYVLRHDGRQLIVKVVLPPAARVSHRDKPALGGTTLADEARGASDVRLGDSSAGKLATGVHVVPAKRDITTILTEVDTAPATDREERLEELVGIDDPQAISALAREVNRVAALEDPARQQAARRLWRHAAALRFADARAVDALRDLIHDTDESVVRIAEQALDDMRTFLRTSGHPAGGAVPQ